VSDADPAVEVLAGCLDRIDIGAHPLLIGRGLEPIAARLRETGDEPRRWSRLAEPGVAARPWPEPEQSTSALLRLPKERAALDFALAGAASCVPAGGMLVIAGANAEGVRSSTRQLDAVAASIETIGIRSHCRVIAGRRRAGPMPGVDLTLGAWRRTVRLDVDPPVDGWVTYPGLFAAGRLDDGTRLLIASLPRLEGAPQVLDFACGTGVVALAVERACPGARIEVLDHDVLALLATSENVPRATATLGTGLHALRGRRFDLIVSNPPVHDGVREDLSVLKALLDAAPGHLAPGGRMLLVVQARTRIERLADASRIALRIVHAGSRFRVIEIVPARTGGIVARLRRDK
jgi:16S rRNA (guanine1207-N2)-methyltransferase